MPMLTLAIYPTSYLTRLTRASILEVMNQDYLRTREGQGNVRIRGGISSTHLKNSLIPVITYLGPLTASILTGGFVAESVFSVPGTRPVFRQLHQPQGLHHDHGCDHLLLSTDRIYEPDL